jgi:Tubulin like
MAIKPVLFIGLGGTGKQVLMSLRRMMLDKYETPSLPHTAFLCIDTDTRLVDLDGKAFDEFTLEAQLTGAERVDVPLDNTRLEQFYNEPERYPHFSTWFDLALKRHGRIENGAAQIRTFGRMAFFQNYQTIRDSLIQKLNGLRTVEVRDAVMRRFGQPYESASVTVYVVFSIAGGTGSGMFLDIAFLLKDMIRETGELSTQAAIVLPSAFTSDQSERVYANAYASLLELEYYNYDRSQPGSTDDRDQALFRVFWTEQDMRRNPLRTIRGPVFGTIWLIGNQARSFATDSQKGVVLTPDQKWCLTDMIAEWLFVQHGEVADVLSARIASDASNFRAPLDNVANMDLVGAKGSNARAVQSLTCRYGSFGLAKIYAPISEIALNVSHMLAGDIVDRWLKRPELAPTALADFERDTFSSVLLGTGTLDQGVVPLIQRLQRYDGTTNVADQARNLTRTQRDRMVSEGLGDDFVSRLEEWRRQTERRYISDMQGGELSEIIRRNADGAAGEIAVAIDRIIYDALGDNRYRFQFAEQALGLLTKTFLDLAAYAESNFDFWRNEVSSANAQKDRVAGYVARESDFVRRTSAELAFEFIETAFASELDRQTYVQMASVYRRAADMVGRGEEIKKPDGSKERVNSGLMKRLADLEFGLRALKNRINDRQRSVASRRFSPLNYRVSSIDIKDIYRTASERPIDDGVVGEIERRIYDAAPFRGERSPWALAPRMTASGEDSVLQEILAFTSRETAHVKDKAIDALKAFGQQFSGGAGELQYRQQVMTEVANGSPWLASTKQDGAATSWDTNQKTLYRVTRGTQLAAPDAVARFDKALMEEFRQIKPALLDGPSDAAYFESEIVGFPLAAVPSIADYREQAYLPHITASVDGLDQTPSRRVVHIEMDTEKYTDIVPLTVSEVTARLDAMELLATALATGLVWPRPLEGGAGYEFIFRFKDFIDQYDRSLGRFDRAVRTLMRGGEDRDALRRQVDARINNETSVDDRVHLLVLLYNWDRSIDRPDAPIRGVDWRRALKRAQDRLVEREPGLSQRAADARMELTAWAEEFPSGSGYLRLRQASKA